MASEAIRFMQSVSASASKIIAADLKQHLQKLTLAARDGGLSPESIDICTKFLLNKVRTVQISQMIFKSMIPETIVSTSSIRNVILWITIVCDDMSKNMISAALLWIGGLLEFSLVDENCLNDFYHLFFHLLPFSSTRKHASWLVHRLTKPEDITRGSVIHMLDLLRKEPRVTQWNALLWLFKSYRPELVPEAIPARNIEPVLSVKSDMRELLEKACERAGKLGHPHCRLTGTVWKIVNTRKRKAEGELLPGVTYIYSSSRDHKEKKYPITLVNNWVILYKKQFDVNIPCKTVSLLQNSFGRYLLAFGEKHLQHRFFYYLHYSLRAAFIDCTSEVSDSEKEEILTKIFLFEELLQESMPVVSRFLAVYLIRWDGYSFRKQILDLVTWVIFSDFSDLHLYILDPLYLLFISCNVEIKCAILQSLGRLIQNTVIQQKKKSVSAAELMEQRVYVQNLSSFIENLCSFGFNHEAEIKYFSNQVLALYGMLAFTAEESEYLFLLPTRAVYEPLFSCSPIHLNIVCNLLYRYQYVLYPRLSALNLRVDFQQDIVLLECYIHDVFECLWEGHAFQNREEGYVFAGMSNETIEKVRELSPNSAFTVQKHFGISSFVIGDKNVKAIRKNTFKNLVKQHLPDVWKFIWNKR